MEEHQSVHQRGQQTAAVWGQFAPTFKVGTLTLSAHQLDLDTILTNAGSRDTQQDVFDVAASRRDDHFALLADLNVRVPKTIEGNLLPGDVLLRELADVYAVKGQSQEAIIERSRKVLSLWTMVNAARTAATPPQAELSVGTATADDLDAALTEHPTLVQGAEDQRAILNKLKSQLHNTATRVDKNNKRWYVAWSGNFVKGSPEIDALSQITTEPEVLPPAKPVISKATSESGTRKMHLEFKAAHASHFKVLRQGPGETAFALRTDALTKGTFDETVSAAGTYQYKVIGNNSTGDGPESDVTSLTVA